jgi:hypothetical protein
MVKWPMPQNQTTPIWGPDLQDSNIFFRKDDTAEPEYLISEAIAMSMIPLT